MDTDPLKHEIRRRLFAARRVASQPAGALANHFTTCPDRAGRGKVCRESTEQGVQVASLDPCPRCNEDGFVTKDSQKSPS